MKRFTFLLTLCVMGIALSANAQEKKITFGVQAGVNFSNLNYSGDYEEDYDLKSKTGFHAGVTMDWNVANNFYIQPSLLFTTRGAKEEGQDGSDSWDWKINMNYLQLPIIASYRFPVTDNVKIGIHAGPYMAYGIGGKSKFEEIYNGTKYNDESSVFDKYTDDEETLDFKRFDAGFRFGLSFHVQKAYLGVNYDLGLSNLCRTGEDHNWDSGEKIKNGAFSISLGYNF